MIVLLLALSPVLFAGCGEKVKPGAEAARPEIKGVKVGEVKETDSDEMIALSGTVKAKSMSMVASKVMGTVTSIKVREGDRVAKGSLLLTIDDSDIAQKVKAAEAARNEAKKALEAAGEQKTLANATYERYKALFDQKAVSRQEFDSVTAQKNTAEHEYARIKEMIARTEAGVAEARVMGGYARVTSPATGIVTEKRIDEGSMAAPGMPLLTIEDSSSYTVEAFADEALMGTIKKGMPVDVEVGSIGKTVKGTVSEVVGSVNPASRTFLIKIALSDEGLRNGQYAKVSLPAGKRSALMVPKDAIVDKGQLTGVYVVDEKGVATYRLVRTGAAQKEMVEVLSGLTAGERIITEGAANAKDGGVVR